MLATLILEAMLVLVSGAPAHAPAADPLAPIAFLEGRWEGTARGEPGAGRSEREYRRELGGKFVYVRNRSVWEPKTSGAAPEVHEDVGMFSYDRTAQKIVLRQFHVEGFVNEYRLAETSADGKLLTFITERIENIAPGWRAREEYRIVGPDEVVETFSLAPPGKDFELYSTTRLVRARPGEGSRPPR